MPERRLARTRAVYPDPRPFTANDVRELVAATTRRIKTIVRRDGTTVRVALPVQFVTDRDLGDETAT